MRERETSRTLSLLPAAGKYPISRLVNAPVISPCYNAAGSLHRNFPMIRIQCTAGRVPQCPLSLCSLVSQTK